MSLTEVLAASFSNLQLAQQQQQQLSSLAQSNMNFSRPDEPTLIPAAGLFPPAARPNTSVGGAQGPGSTDPLLCNIPTRAGLSTGSACTLGYGQPNLASTANGEGVNQVRLRAVSMAVFAIFQFRCFHEHFFIVIGPRPRFNLILGFSKKESMKVQEKCATASPQRC